MINESHIKRIKEANLEYGDDIVFCDIDGTIFRDSLYLEMFNYMVIDGYISEEEQDAYEYKMMQQKNREITYDDFLFFTIGIVINVLENRYVPLLKLEEYGDMILNENVGRIIMFTMTKLKELQSQGWKVILISGSPQKIIDKFAEYYNFDTALGSIYHIDKYGYMNGNIELMANSKNKLNIIKHIKKAYNINNIIALGDTNGDYAMLELSDMGYAINPTYELYEKIKDMHHVIAVVERKDLALELDVEARQYINFKQFAKK